MTTTTSSSGFSYNVFLSFRGEDTRHTFTDHLYAALKQAEIQTFRDEDAMDRGKLLGPELKKAIHESAISIIVFSTNYASSKWCLDEVLTIIQEQQERLSSPSKHEVVPVFYHVDPSDVRNQTGSFKEAFDKYDDMIEAETDPQKKIEWSEKVKAWRVSLEKVGSLTGMVLANNGSEVEFISKIVNVIRKKLNYNLLYVEDKLVGIENHVAEVESWLQDPSPDAVILVIHGMGGIGKSTLAKCIFNSNKQEYDVSCFLANIHETSSQHDGLVRLQTQLLSTILRSERQEVIWNLDEGINKVANALCNKRVLLVLDDIKTRKQLLYLLGRRQQFYTGSKVIITTRDISLLTYFKIPPMVHTIQELGPNHSKQLFSMCAFHSDHPDEPYIVQTELVVQHCGGLPLALEVLGSLLNRKTIDEWEDVMRKLEAIPNSEIQKLLQLSYDDLEDEDKDLFLHVACFFVGEDKDFIVKLLAECGLYPVVGVKNLKDRCLLSIENGRVMMHQLIKEMGQEVVRQESPKDPGERSRLWKHEDSYNVLRENEGTEKVEGLALDMQRIKGMNSSSIVNRKNGKTRCFEDFSGHTFPTNKENFKVVALKKMKNLMLLQLDHATFSGDYKKLPKKLRWLRWHGFPLSSIPSDVPLQKLVVLDLRYSKLEEVWDGFKEIGSLKILNLSYSLKLMKTPDFRGLPSLENLLLEGCESLTQVCKSIGYLERLALLDISGCISLRDVPCLPTSLVTLRMHGCSNFKGLGKLVQRLYSVSPSTHLTHMNVSRCSLVDNSFPEDWSKLFSLKYLNISENHITSLPGCVKSLPCLEELYADRCSHLLSVQDVPESVAYLYIPENSSLEILQITHNTFEHIIADECNNIRAVEGCFKLESIKNVDSKIIRNLGLVLISENGKGFNGKDFGIYKENAYAGEVYFVSK